MTYKEIRLSIPMEIRNIIESCGCVTRNCHECQYNYTIECPTEHAQTYKINHFVLSLLEQNDYYEKKIKELKSDLLTEKLNYDHINQLYEEAKKTVLRTNERFINTYTELQKLKERIK